MSEKINDGGPAFPGKTTWYGQDGEAQHIFKGGMSLRDYFAGQALIGFTANTTFGGATGDEKLARWSYDLADAMIKAQTGGGSE